MFDRRAVIQMQGERHRAAHGDIADIAEKAIPNKIVFAGVDGDDRRRVGGFSFFHHRADEAAIRHVERTNGETVLAGGFQ